MSDDTKSDDNTVSEWAMPEPVFRTTPGRTPLKADHLPDPTAEMPTEPGFNSAPTVETEVARSAESIDVSQDDIPTEPGFQDAPTVEIDGLQSLEEAEIPVDKPAKVTASPAKPKKRGCGRSFLTVVSLIVLAVLGVVIALIYFIYYKSADTGPF